MTNSDDVALRGEMLRAAAEPACSRARTLVAQYRDLTRTVAGTRERAAETMDRMEAERQRQWAERGRS